MNKIVKCIVILFAFWDCSASVTKEMLPFEEISAERGWICKKPLITDLISGKIQTGCTPNKIREYRLFTMPVTLKKSTTDSAALIEGCEKLAGYAYQGEGVGRTVEESIEKHQGGITEWGCNPGVFMMRYSEKLKEEHSIVGCCALNSVTGKCIPQGEPVNTDSCVCLGYFKYAGGLDVLVDDFFKLGDENCRGY